MSPNTLEFARTHYDRIVNWHKNAEIKAQIIIGLTGTLTAVISGSILTKPSDILNIIAKFNIWTYLFLMGAAVSAIGGLIAAIHSFLLKSKKIDHKENQSHDGYYDPKNMFFFGHIAKLKCENYVESFKKIDEIKELEVYAHNIFQLSTFVYKKQKWTNYGFLFVVISIILMMLASATYIISIRYCK